MQANLLVGRDQERAAVPSILNLGSEVLYTDNWMKEGTPERWLKSRTGTSTVYYHTLARLGGGRQFTRGVSFISRKL